MDFFQKADLDFWDCSGRKKVVLKPNKYGWLRFYSSFEELTPDLNSTPPSSPYLLQPNKFSTYPYRYEKIALFHHK